MYLDHYQLKVMPFEIRPDPQFLWLGEKHEEAFAILKFGIVENKGFTVLIGGPGTGKSTLLNAIVGSFGPKIRFAKIADPALNEMDFFNFAANAFDMGRTFDNKADFFIHLQQFIGDTAARSEKVVLVIDEAQRLKPELLEQIRILSNFERPDQKVLSCVFAGQNEFLDMVKHNQAMSQRVFFSHVIQPLTEAETGDYIAHRLKVAGAAGKIFSSGTGREIFLLSRGNPRLINIICDQALLSGYTCNLKTIRPDIIRKCTQNTLIPFEEMPEPEPEAAHSNRMSQAVVELKKDAVDAVADPGRRLPAPTPSVSNRKASYWALAAVVVLIAVGYGYYSGAFGKLLSGTQSSSRSDGISRNNIEAAISPQTVEKAGAAQGASDIAQLQGQLLVQDGYLRLTPTAGKLGSLPLLSTMLQSVSWQLFDSSKNKEAFKLPPYIQDMQIAGEKLIVISR